METLQNLDICVYLLIYTICTCVRSTLQKANNAGDVTDIDNNSNIVQDI